MMKRQTNWGLLDYLLLTTTLVAAVQQMTALWLVGRQSSLLGGTSFGLMPVMLVILVGAFLLLLLVLRRYDGLLERVVGVACIWGIWYFCLSIATFYNMLRIGQQAVG